MMEGNKNQFIEELIYQGEDSKKAFLEINNSIDRIIYFAGWPDKINSIFGSVNPVASSHFNFTFLEPMGVVGIVIASIVNMFIGSAFMDYIISIIGVLVFTGLTAYDVQKIKNIGNQIDQGSETAQRMMVLGALTLYLDFINLFLMLLRLFGNRD